MEKFASADYTAGQLNAIVKLLRSQGGKEGVEKFLRGELTISQPEKAWREENGVIYFSVTSDGTTGAEWIARIEKKGFRIGDYGKQVLLSKDFKPTTGIITEVAVLKGMLFENNQRITKNIRTNAQERKLETPTTEIACLIREKFTDEDIKAMGLVWIVTMHEPIKKSACDPDLLITDCRGFALWLNSFYVTPDGGWLDRRFGFAFSVSQVAL